MSYSFGYRDPFPVQINTTLFLLFLLFLTAVIQKAKSVDQKFEACEPRSCGHGPNISYPFWIPLLQNHYCGYPGYEVSCLDEGPSLLISDDSYLITDIFYANHSLPVVSTEAESDNCPVPLHNFTLNDTPYEFSRTPLNLFFFYNCTISVASEHQSYPVNCASNVTGNHSFALFEHDLELEYSYLNYSLETCKSTVSAPVDTNGLSLVDIGGMNYSGLLKIGFLLKWTETSNCSGCEATGGRCGFDNEEFWCFCPNGSHRQNCTGSTISLKRKLLIAFGCLAAGIIFTCLFFFIYRRHRYRKGGPFIPIKSKSISASTAPQSRSIPSINPSSKDLEKGSTYFGVHVFTYEELQDATDNFNSNKELGDGGFGSVYHGKLRDGREVAVKRLYENNYRRVEQFMNEVEILTRLRHQNLVTLYGCTSRHSRELLLVYEFIANGTVADNLHGDRAEAASLTWPIRMRIAIETASALSYLHASDVIHRDVKTTNILLDNNFGVKVADFGLSRLFPTDVTHVSTAPQGTPGYVDPEYHQFYQLTDKSDVYSFGVVLIELISSKAAVDVNRNHREINLANMAINKIQNQALHELVDPSLGFGSDYAVKMMITSVAELAFRCLQLEKEMRPSMDEVLETLKGIEKENYKVEKAALVIRTDKLGLLKNINPPFSPDSVTDKWVSRSTTPNTSA